MEDRTYRRGMTKEEVKALRLSEQNYNTQGELMTIVDYENNRAVTVEFKETGKKKICEYDNFIRGVVKDDFYPSVYDVGFLGNGKRSDKNGVKKKSYKVWHSMLMRCYDPKVHESWDTYKECEVCDEWKCFETFEKWFDENYYELPNEAVHLDKDILIKGNKIYSPETCVFAPARINDMFSKVTKVRGDCPIGVYYDKQNNNYKVRVNIHGKLNNYLGRFKTKEEGFAAYKVEKEKLIKQVADEYKDVIPQRLYEALYRYEVEITD